MNEPMNKRKKEERTEGRKKDRNELENRLISWKPKFQVNPFLSSR